MKTLLIGLVLGLIGTELHHQRTQNETQQANIIQLQTAVMNLNNNDQILLNLLDNIKKSHPQVAQGNK